MKVSEALNGIPQVKIDDLREYMKQKVENLNRLDIMEVSWNPIATTINMLATKKALEILTNILGDFMSFSEQKPKGRDPRDMYNV